jgi:DNA polymerase-3 subunit alpha
MTYFNNHNHTALSNAALGFPDVVNKVPELIQKAYDLELEGFTITDHECISAHIEALKYYDSMQKDRPFKLALGNEIYLMSEEEDKNNRENINHTPYYHFILTALDTEGHKQIRKLSTKAWLRAYTYKGIMRRPTYYSDLKEIIVPNRGHVIASSACLGSYLDKLILAWKQNNDENAEIKARQFIRWCEYIFGKGNFFLEIQPCNQDNKEQQIVNTTLSDFGKEYSIPLIVTTDSHYLSKDTAFIHETFLKSKDGDREVSEFYATAYMMAADELRNYLKLQFTDDKIDEIFANTMLICDRIQEYDLEHTPVIPQIPSDKIPEFKIEHKFKEFYDKYPEFSYYAHIDNIQDKYFFYRIEQALIKLILNKGKDVETYIARLEDEFHELRLISEAFNSSMASYYTTMSKIIELVWEADSLSMPSRGSGCGFLVCYLLEITQIDPVPLGDYMPFWRHLSAERGVEIADIDNDSQASRKEAIAQAIKGYFGEDKVLNVATFSKLTSKTAIEKACKGLGISDDVAGYLKSLIPVERGKIWSLTDCLNGNKKKDRKPIKELITEFNKYDHLKECALGLEGLIVNRGLHAAGLTISNDPYVDSVAAMKSPNGVPCTCYDLIDSEYCSQVKVDMLTVIAADKIRKTMDLLVEHGHMEWQGSLKATYWKYLHPDVLEYNNPEMWDMIRSIYSVFQFDTQVSVRALNQTHPKSVMDLSAANSLLRLMAPDGQEQPIDKYARFKEDINNWYKEMDEYGLNKEEQEVLKKHLSSSYGMCDSQERTMLLSMDKQVSGFSLKQANKLRKSIARKDAKVLEETRILFYDSCEEMGTRKELADYVWNVLFAMSFGYSFSQLHSYAYSVIALQELNLNYFYPPVYWNCACLTVESQTDETNDKGGNTNYGKIAKSIYKMRSYSIFVQPPSINQSEVSFTPIEETNSILFGLGGIAGINQSIAQEIVDGRPYTSFKQFYDYFSNKEQTQITKSKFIALIKAGCFDEFNTDRVHIMKQLCCYDTDLKTSLTTANLPMAIKMGVNIPKEYLSPYAFKRYVLSKQNFYCNDPKFKSKKHYIIDDRAMNYFMNNCISELTEDKDYYYENDRLIVVDKSLEKVLKTDIKSLEKVLNTQEVIDDFNKKTLRQNYESMIKGNENPKHWAMEAVSFYPDGSHELENINFEEYNISHFSDLPEEPQFIEKSFRGRTWKQYDISRICGVVLARNDNNHLVDILTPDNEVINIKFNGGQYAYYKQTIGEDKNWFAKGQLVAVSGYRRGEDSFVAKKYKNSIFKHTVMLITDVYENGTVNFQLERDGVEEQ